MRSTTVLLALAVAACSPQGASVPPRGTDTAAAPTSAAPAAPAASADSAASDTARIARLEREARALAHTDGCTAAAQCRVAPLGHRACGGPRDYLPYCALTTDSAALYRKLDELARAEEAYQAKAGVVSTCEFRAPPNVTLAGGRCAAASARPSLP